MLGALEYKDKTPEFWSNVLFSDETAVELNLMSPINRVRRFKFENPNKLQFISPKVKFPLKVMFWGGVSAHHKTNLVECIGSMNSQSYKENVLCKEVLPLMNRTSNLVSNKTTHPVTPQRQSVNFLLTTTLTKSVGLLTAQI